MTSAPPVTVADGVVDPTPPRPAIARNRTEVRVASAVAVAVVVAATFVWYSASAKKPASSGGPAPVPQTSGATATLPTVAPAAGPAGRSSAVASDKHGTGGAHQGGATRAGATPGTSSLAPIGGRTTAAGASANSLSKYPGGDSTAARDAVRPSSSAAADPPPATPSASRPAATAVSATTADARAVAREFVTMLNQRRWHELELLAPLPGDAALRAEVVRLTHNAQDFSAGFDRVASPPESIGDGFVTECVVDLEWHGGHRLVLVHLRAATLNGAWHLAAFGTESAD
jgi:hypothetical protein